MKIINTYKYSKMNKKAKLEFIGDCVTGLNDSLFQRYIAEDATELAQIVDNGQQIDQQQFFNIASVHPDYIKMFNSNPENYEYYYNFDKNIAWFYDNNKDIEYFYR